MRAYEFYAKPKNGVIPIPEQYQHQITNDVMVIVLEKKPHSPDSDVELCKKSELLSPPTLDTRGWRFDREEAR